MRIFRFMSIAEFRNFLNGETIEGKFVKGKACFLEENIPAREKEESIKELTDLTSLNFKSTDFESQMEELTELISPIFESGNFEGQLKDFEHLTLADFMNKIRENATAEVLVEFETTDAFEKECEKVIMSYQKYLIQEIHSNGYSAETLHCASYKIDLVNGFKNGIGVDTIRKNNFEGVEQTLTDLEKAEQSLKNQEATNIAMEDTEIGDITPQEFEEEYKSTTYDAIAELGSMQAKVILDIQKTGKSFNLGNDLRNIAITANNKLVELQHEFERAGISIYTQKYENYGPLNLNFTTASYIGKAIIDDLIGYINRGQEQLLEYDKTMGQILDEKTQKSQSLETVSPLRKIFAKIRSFFMTAKEQPSIFTQEEIEKIGSHLADYKETDKQLYEYNLRDNIISSIVKRIRNNEGNRAYRASDVPGLLEESVIPDLQKLGLAELIPTLQQSLIEEYKKDLPNPEIYQIKEEDMWMYVPDFNRDRQQDGQDTRAYLEQLLSGKTSIKESISLGDLSSIDDSVSASDRRKAMETIQEEFKGKEQNNPNKTQADEEISL